MKRRAFLSLLGAAGLAPGLNAVPAAGAAPKALYSRYTYGYAVFWVRHGGRFGAAQLAKTMRITVPQAEAMIEQMLDERVVRATQGGLRATKLHGGTRASGHRGKPSQARRQLYWRFRRVGLRAKALQSQLLSSEISRTPRRALT